MGQETAQRYMQEVRDNGYSTYAAVVALAARVDSLESCITEVIGWLPQHPEEARRQLQTAMKGPTA